MALWYHPKASLSPGVARMLLIRDLTSRCFLAVAVLALATQGCRPAGGFVLHRANADASGAAPPAAETVAVLLTLDAVRVKPLTGALLFECDLTLDNQTGNALVVYSNFYSAFDGLWLVVMDEGGKILKKQSYLYHQSPYTWKGQPFLLPPGKTNGTINFPVSELPAEAKTVQVKLVGTLPGSAFEGQVVSNKLTVTLR
jgi:hypothetical protein